METTNSAKNLAAIKNFIEVSRTQYSADDIRSGKAHYEMLDRNTRKRSNHMVKSSKRLDATRKPISKECEKWKAHALCSHEKHCDCWCHLEPK